MILRRNYCDTDAIRFGPVDAPNVYTVYLSKYRLTWSIASTSYSKRFKRVVGYFWVLNCKLDWIPIGVVWNSWRSPLSLGCLPSFSHTWDVRILEVKEDSFDANGHQYQFHGDREFVWGDGTIQTLESVDRTPANFLSLPGCIFFPT